MRLQQPAKLVSIGAVIATVLTPYPANASVRPTLKVDRGLTGTLTVQTEPAITPGLEAVIQQYQRVHPGVHFSLIKLEHHDSARREHTRSQFFRRARHRVG